MVKSSDQITSFSDRLVLVTIGLKVITLKVLNLLIQFSMLSVRKLKVVIVSKDSKFVTHSVVVLDLVWELYSSQKSEKNTQIESWKLSQFSHHQRSLIQSLNHTMLPSQSINSLKMPMKSKLLITKPSMTFALEL